MSHERAPGRTAPGASAAVRHAFQALAAVPGPHRPRPGVLAPRRPPGGAREAWVEGLTEALAEAAVLTLAVQSGSIHLGDEVVLEDEGRGFAAGLSAGGLRGITIFAGARDEELATLAWLLLLTADLTDPEDLRAAAWEADLVFIHLDLVAAPSRFGHPPGPGWQPTLALLDAAPITPGRTAMLGSPALQVLRELRGTLPPDPSIFSDGHPVSQLPPELGSEAAVVRTGADIDPATLGEVVAASVVSEPEPTHVARRAAVLVGTIVELIGGALDVTPLVHAALALLDPDLTPGDAVRDAARAGFRQAIVPPLQPRLAARLPSAETPAARGLLFSLFSLLPDAEGLVDVIPAWSLRVLADTVLLRETEVGTAKLDHIRARIGSRNPRTVQLGLAMAARLEDTRLLDGVLALADHENAEVREGVLFALRQQRGTRVRELVQRRLADSAEAVRVEALRYTVAHQVSASVPWIEARLADPALASISDGEARALCIAFARLGKDRAEGPLFEIASGRRKVANPALPRFALHGLRAIGSARARASLEHVAAQVPRLREEAQAMLTGEAR